MRWNSRVLCSFWDANNSQQLLQRYHHTCVIYENKHMFLYGGIVADNKNTNSFIKYNLESGEYNTLNGSIITHYALPMLSHHTMTLIRDKIFIYGGKNELEETCGDIFLFDLQNNEWSKIRCNGGQAPAKGKNSYNPHAPKRYG
jgi:hypothetical protein